MMDKSVTTIKYGILNTFIRTFILSSVLIITIFSYFQYNGNIDIIVSHNEISVFHIFYLLFVPISISVYASYRYKHKKELERLQAEYNDYVVDIGIWYRTKIILSTLTLLIIKVLFSVAKLIELILFIPSALVSQRKFNNMLDNADKSVEDYEK